MRYLPAFLLLFAFASFAQQSHDLKITIGNAAETPLQSKAYLVGYYINQRKVVDSMNAGNTLLFKLSDTLPNGLYNMMLYTDLKDANDKYQRLSFDVIHTGENLNFQVEVKAGQTLGAVDPSGGENQYYNNHYKENKRFEQKEHALQTALEQYPPDDVFYLQLQEQLKTVKKQHADFIQLPCDSRTHPVACIYLNAINATEKKSLGNIDFSSPLLKHSPFIPGIVWGYLDEINADTTLTAEAKTTKLKTRLDETLGLLKKDNEVYRLMLPEIIKYYEMTGNNAVALYLNEKYLLPEANSDAADRLKEKTQVLASIQPGQPAPDIELNVMGFQQKLYDIKAKYTLLLFWDTDCPHCQETARELLDFYHQHKDKGLEVVALALDESEKEWLNYISEHGIDWLNFQEPEGWKGKAVKGYNIQSTPSMFLLDENKKIVAKVAAVADLKGKIR